MGGLTKQQLAIAGAVLAALLVTIFYFSQPAAVPTTVGGTVAPAGNAKNILAPGPLSEIASGPADAKVTIVEYASMSCPHCAMFHTTVYPELKKKYVDTGKVRFIFREFPLNHIAFAASMLTRCVSDEKTKPLIEELFKRQNEWLVSGDALDRLFDVVKQAGFTKASFDKCLDDKALYDKLMLVRKRGDEQFDVNSTPTLFINGEKYKGGLSVAALSSAIEDRLK